MTSHAPDSEPRAVDLWLDQLPRSLPWRAVKSPTDASKLISILRSEGLDTNSLLAAMLWIRLGEIDRSHAIVQEDASAMGSYLHGIVHRLEADYWNSNYWMRRVHDTPLLRHVSESVVRFAIAEGLQSKAIDAGIVRNGEYQPANLVTACENLKTNAGAKDIELVESIAYAEWSVLWGNLHSH